MSKRSSKIILTNEARVLRELRIEAGLSMRRAGQLIGKSDSTIAHIETGRMAIPGGARLEQLLEIYGKVKVKSFKERVRKWKKKLTKKDELLLLLERTNRQETILILGFVRSLLISDRKQLIGKSKT
jgi:transcriptional regulator with XRE-family HTH domain